MELKSLDEALDSTFLQEGTGSIGELIDEVLSNDASKDKKKKKTEKRVELSELISTIPFHDTAIPHRADPFANTSDQHEQWLYKQKAKDRIMARDKIIASESKKREEERVELRRSWARDAFEMWKFKKDAQDKQTKKLQKELEDLLASLKIPPTKAEPLPGYISAWSCDTELARKIQKACPREPPSQ